VYLLRELYKMLLLLVINYMRPFVFILRNVKTFRCVKISILFKTILT